MRLVFFIAALASVLAVALICVFLFVSGVPAMAKIGLFNFLGGTKWRRPTRRPAMGSFR